MKAVTFDRNNCGGKAFDSALVKYIAEDFKAKTKLDPFQKPRALLKLTSEVEKVKKQMSANTNKLPINIECFMEEKDLSSRIDRATFQGLIADELQRIQQVMLDCLKASEWKLVDIYAVEIVGGSSRVPAVKAAIEYVFDKVPQTTLNSDEAVSRGCALQCAILSPTFRVREFSVTDLQVLAIFMFQDFKALICYSFAAVWCKAELEGRAGYGRHGGLSPIPSGALLQDPHFLPAGQLCGRG